MTFRLHGNDSLKGKRKIVKSLIEKSRNRFPVSIAEVDDLDRYQRATLGIAVIGNDSRLLNAILDKVVDYMAGMGLADLESHRIELIPL
uniref:DUF503 domain-containing protein n=1 Tax=Desulfacinum infernum TaxID=35837 RepID=A0A832EKM1_9BACT